MPRLARTLLVIKPDDGQRVIVTPDQDAPAWVEGVITDDEAWSSDWPKPQRGKAAGQEAGTFDPGAHNLPDVKAYLDGLTDDDEGRTERDRVLAAERSGKARAGVLGD